MADESDKSVVVWWPNLRLGVPDAAEWASLCLWYDQIMPLTTLYVPIPLRPERASIADVIEELSKEGLIHPLIVYSPDDAKTYLLSLRTWMEQVWKQKERVDHLESVEAMIGFVAAAQNGLPFAMNDPTYMRYQMMDVSAEQLSGFLATTAISQLALPAIRPAHVHDLLEARTALKDELLEFRAGIRKLTWLLHQQVKGEKDLIQIRHEADVLVRTVIEGAVMSLENRMRQHENKRIRRMLFGTGRILVDAAKMVLPGGWQEKLIAGGKTLLQTATEIDSAKPPEDQIATYLYKLKRRLKS